MITFDTRVEQQVKIWQRELDLLPAPERDRLFVSGEIAAWTFAKRRTSDAEHEEALRRLIDAENKPAQS